jgi:hypothetical protein
MIYENVNIFYDQTEILSYMVSFIHSFIYLHVKKSITSSKTQDKDKSPIQHVKCNRQMSIY